MAEAIQNFKVFPPGEYLQDELDERGWRQADLAFIIGQPASFVNQIVKGTRQITPETARALGDALGQPAEVWIKLQASYQLAMTGSKDHDIEKKAMWFNVLPIRVMQRRGWIATTKDTQNLEKELCDFFETDSMDSVSIMPHAPRKSGNYLETSPIQQAWLARAKKIAKSFYPDSKYNEKKLPELVNELSALKAHPEDARHIFKVLSKYGIRFVVVEQLPKTKIDAACFWLDKNSPVIAMSLRIDRNDNLWFNLGHELGHIKNRDGEVVDDSLLDEESLPIEGKSQIEKQADLFGQQFVIDQNVFLKWANRQFPFFRTINIMAFAMMNNVHPGLIVGQLHHKYKDKFPPTHGRSLLAKIRDFVTDAAVTDGWGHSITLT